MRATVLLALLFTGCPGEEDPVVDEATGCDQTDPTMCALPYPSNTFTTSDSSTETGLRVDFQESEIPDNVDGNPFDNTLWNRMDGFAVGTAMLAYFEDVSLDGVIPLDDLEAYADAAAKTVLINTETGERVPHFVELDVSAEDDDERLLMIRPVERLEFATRYVVGIRGLTKTDGSSVDVSDGFAALRDGEATSDGDIEASRARYDDGIFPVLEADGFDRSELQLAWDFTTVSRSSLLGDLLWIREDALSYVENEGMTYEIDDIEDRDCSEPNNGRVIMGRITNFPLYRESDTGMTGLARDADGQPTRNGTTEVEWTLRIPCSVVADPAPRKLIQYGHGFFGDHGESGTGWLRRFTDEREYVLIASDWTGMEERDATAIPLELATNASNFSKLPEGTYQGFVEMMAVLRLARNELAVDPNTQLEDANGDLQPTINGDDFAYYGISQGGILGGAYVGMSPDIERAVFGVTGGPYSFLTHRSANFEPFFLIFKAKYDDHRHTGLIIQHLQGLWDAGDNTGWGYELNRDVPEGWPTKQVLIQNAIGDAQVTEYGGHLQARMYGATTVAPQTRPIFGIEERTAPFTGSAIVEWEFSDVPETPLTNSPPSDANDPHECPRRNDAAQEQVVHFLETGEVQQFCEGVCADVQTGCR